jgi:hypothetical protein
LTYKDNFTVKKSKVNKYNEIKDSYQKRGISLSNKLVDALIKQYEDEQKGSKITAFNGQQSKLPLLPPVYEVPTQADLEGLSYNELRTIFSASQEWVALSRKKIEMIQKQR